MMMNRPLPLALLALALSGCAARTVRERWVTPADLADPMRTRITNVLGTGGWIEDTPAAISREAILDEAVITRLTGREVCFGLTMRTAAEIDSPLSYWRALLNGREVHFDGETTETFEYPYTGERDVISVQGWGRRFGGSFRMTEPIASVLQVVVRRGDLCAAIPREAFEEGLELVLENGAAYESGSETFVWHLAGG